MARLQPLPIDTVPELADSWKVYLKALGFVPNFTNVSLLAL